MERITDRKTKKCALYKPTISKALKGLEEKGYITINKGNARAGTKDTYTLNPTKLNADNSFRISYFINILVILVCSPSFKRSSCIFFNEYISIVPLNSCPSKFKVDVYIFITYFLLAMHTIS